VRFGHSAVGLGYSDLVGKIGELGLKEYAGVFRFPIPSPLYARFDSFVVWVDGFRDDGFGGTAAGGAFDGEVAV
jgi:hypothetical protein